MAKWRYFSPDNWNFLFPQFSHKELRLIEDVIAADDEAAKMMARALQGQGPAGTFLEIHLFRERPLPGTIGMVIKEAKQDAHATTLKGKIPIAKSQMVFALKWVFENEIDTSFMTNIQFLLKNSPDITNGYQVYEHILQDENGQWHPYWGITKRNWKTRYEEHLAAAKRGSQYLFHKELRELLPKNLSEAHQIPVVGFTEKEAMDHEEWFVEHFSLFPDNPLGLNMIPGGYAGIQALHRLKVLPKDRSVTPEERDRVIETYLNEHPRKGVSNPLIAAMWKDEVYAESVICGPEGRLSTAQVREIRRLSSLGWDAQSIVDVVGARNIGQVERVLGGKTYTRIH